VKEVMLTESWNHTDLWLQQWHVSTLNLNAGLCWRFTC